MKSLFLFLLFMFVAGSTTLWSQPNGIPGDHWQQYIDVTEAGFAADKLESVRSFYDSSGAAGLFVVHHGHVVAAWGEVNRRFLMASVRKSFMNALIGIAVERGDLQLSQTMAALGIDDIGQLTAEEKLATVEDLLSARSGVYQHRFLCRAIAALQSMNTFLVIHTKGTSITISGRSVIPSSYYPIPGFSFLRVTFAPTLNTAYGTVK